MSDTVSREEFEAVLDRLQDLEDGEFMRAVEADPSDRDYLPIELVKRLVAVEHPVKVFREHRRLSVSDLAERSGVARSYLSEVEAGKKPGSVSAYRRLAAALGVAIDDLVPRDDSRVAA
jgi:DNA-binding Xre family transcriptional regulator